MVCIAHHPEDSESSLCGSANCWVPILSEGRLYSLTLNAHGQCAAAGKTPTLATWARGVCAAVCLADDCEWLKRDVAFECRLSVSVIFLALEIGAKHINRIPEQVVEVVKARPGKRIDDDLKVVSAGQIGEDVGVPMAVVALAYVALVFRYVG